MASNTHLVRVLVDAGCTERRAESFSRVLDDMRPCGISSTQLEAWLIKHEAKNVERFNNLMEQYMAMQASPAFRGELGDALAAFRH